MKPLIRLSEHLYELFLKLYPFSYRKEFGPEMKYVYSESIKDTVARQGKPGLVVFWIRSGMDGLTSLLNEILDDSKGGENMNTTGKSIIYQNRVFLWLALGTAFILSIPFLAMQFTREVDWKIGDFMIMGVLIFGTGFTFVHVARVIPRRYWTLAGIVFVAALLLVWVHLAVGIVDTWPLAGS